MSMVLAAGAMVAVVARPVHADQYTDQIGADQQQLQLNQAQIAALQNDIAARQQAETKLVAVLTALDSEIAKTTAKQNAARVTLLTIKANLAQTHAQLTAAQAQLAADKQQLANQLIIVYEMQQQDTTLDNLLSSGNFNDFWTGVIDSRRISATENDEVGQIDAVRTAIQADYDSISAQEAQEQRVVDQLAATQQQLDAQQSQQQGYLALQRRLAAEDQRNEQEAQVADNQLNAQIKQLQAEEAAALAAGGGNGVFAWPDSGPITQGFGCTTFTFEPYDPNCATRHFHNGIDIAGPCGANIYAADSGIAYPQPYQGFGFGNYIIIVHGNGWETLYGHMSAFAVGYGQTVHRGDQIGWEGSTGNSTGCHLHFGISRNGTWVNPLQYLS
ncbi:MAG: M23 family metallopeptidase [Candidatus Dormibacteraeota bacterium]|nr:M23 family metallopeptidase [Candidatus Dormibacteraeota bacterium]